MTQPDAIGQAGLRFFGQMSASISHELKNILAIVKENAGLLNDYLNLMAKGHPFDPERFQSVASRIEAQTLRADTLIKNLNRFAHTVDNPSQSVSLNETLSLLTALYQRQANLQQVKLMYRSEQFDMLILSSPFLLLNVLGLVLTFALKTVPVKATLVIAWHKKDDFAEICFNGLKNLDKVSLNSFFTAQENMQIKAIGAQVYIKSMKEQLIISLPLKLIPDLKSGA